MSKKSTEKEEKTKNIRLIMEKTNSAGKFIRFFFSKNEVSPHILRTTEHQKY